MRLPPVSIKQKSPKLKKKNLPKMFFAVAIVFFLVKTCASFSAAPPYGVCDSFNTGHADSTPSTATATISLLNGDQPVSCYLPAQTYTMVVNASKRFTGILLQSDVGNLPASNQKMLPNKNLALGPCLLNTISQRNILNVDSIQVSFKAPDFGAVTFRYTIVFRYNESLVNRATKFQQCPPATALATTQATAVDVQSTAAAAPLLQTNATCNKTTVQSHENQTYNASGHTYRCVLTQPVNQAYCEAQCQKDGYTLCCAPDSDHSTTSTKLFQCKEDSTPSKTIFISLPVVRRMRCVCTIASDGIC